MAVAVYVNVTILGYSLKKDATTFKTMGRFGTVLFKPGNFGLILVWVESALKVIRNSSANSVNPSSDVTRWIS